MVYVIEVVRFGGWEKDQTSFEHRGTYDECMLYFAVNMRRRDTF